MSVKYFCLVLLGLAPGLAAQDAARAGDLPENYALNYEPAVDQRALYAEARARAAFAGKLLILIVGDQDCPPCRALKMTLARPEVAAALAPRFAVRAIALRYRYAEAPGGRETLRTFHAGARNPRLPQLFVVDPRSGRGRELDSKGLRGANGGFSPSALAAALTDRGAAGLPAAPSPSPSPLP